MEKRYTRALKTVLQSRKTYTILGIILLLYEGYFLCFATSPKIPEEKGTIEAKITDYKWDDDVSKIQLQLKDKKRKYFATYHYKTEEKEELKKVVQYGNTIKVTGTEYYPEASTIPNTFDYQKYLVSQKIDACLEIEKITFQKDHSLFQGIRQKLRDWIEEKENAQYLKMLILGIKENFSEEVDEVYRKNGISHIFVISGLHLAFLHKFLLTILKKIIKKEANQYVGALIFLTGYVNLLGNSISSKRAYDFYLFLTINKVFHFKLSNQKIFCLNLAWNLFLNPYLPYQIGFQYSFLLSFAYIFFGPKEKRKLKSLWKTSVFAFLFSAPITINNNFTLNPWSFVLNIIMIPGITKFLFPTLLLSFFFPPLEWIAKIEIQMIESINLSFSHMPFSSIVVPKIPGILFLLYYFCLVFFFLYHKRTYFIIWCILCLSTFIRPKIDPNGYLYFLDVGEGDSALIISPYQKEVLLIDTGKTNHYLAQNIVTFIHSLGIAKIDNVILSHGDNDHAGNIFELDKSLKIETITLNEGTKNDWEQKISDTLSSKIQTDMKTAKIKGKSLTHCLNGEENHDSRIVHLCIFKTCTLFMGDAGVDVEEEIIKKYQMKTDILKVGHHGSKTSTSIPFLEGISPQLAIISAGRENRYGHPHQEVLESLRQHEIKIRSTKESGTIKIKITPKRYTIRATLP